MLLMLTIMAACFSGCASATNQPEVSVVLDGHTLSFDVPPSIINDRTMVPMRKIFESLGYEVDWEQNSSKITAIRGEDIIVMYVGIYTIERNGSNITIDTAPQIVEGRTLVPVRAISESSGCSVQWDGDAKVVYISSNPNNNANDESYKPNVTFSSSIGEINGIIYCAREASYGISNDGLYQTQNVPTTVLLPVEVGQYTMISSFCYYDGYVYYVETEGGSSDYSTWLYRCKPDWSGKELLYEMVCDWKTVYEGERFFVIDNGILYYGSYGSNSEVVTINLSTLQKGKGYMPTYTVNDNGVNHDGKYSDDYGLKIFNDKTFFTDNDKNLYIFENDTKKVLATNAYLDGGLAGDYLYYAEYNWQTNREVSLYRISLTTGEREFIDSRMPAGGGGPYFCW